MNAISFFDDFIQTRKGLHRGSPIVVLPNTKTLNIQLTIRKYIQQQAKETIIGILNLLYGMTTNLNKRIICSLIRRPLAPGDEADLLDTQCSLIRRPLAPGDEADLLYTQCSLMSGSLSEKPRFPEKGSRHETILNAANIDQNMYLSVVFYSTQCITTIYVEVIFTVYDFNIACS